MKNLLNRNKNMSKGKKNNNKADKSAANQLTEESLNSTSEEFIYINPDDGKISNLEYVARGFSTVTKAASSTLTGTGSAIQKIAANPSHAFGDMVVQAKNASGVRMPYHERGEYKTFFKQGAEENPVTKYLDKNFGGASRDVAGYTHKYNSDTGRVDKYSPTGDITERVHGAVIKVIVDKLQKEQQEEIANRQATNEGMSRI